MTIQRQYILPNCSLVLDGLSTDASNVLSILANAEFKIVGIAQPLAGGLEFFKAIAGAVSAYCQRLLSGLDHPDHLSSQASLVAVEPVEGQYHHLIIKPEVLDDSLDASSANQPQVIQLSTVQLFDMAEAIDQCYADVQTLPDFSVPLVPLPRKYVRAAEPLTQRVIPPLLGLGTLTAAALGLFFLPVPELVEPDALEQQAPLADTLTQPEAAGAAPDSPESETEPEAEVTGAEAENPTIPRPITDSAQLAQLQQQVQQQISSELPADATFEQPLSYQLSVAANGDIVGYNPLDNDSSENLDSTPLPELTYIPVDDTAVASVAQFEVTFASDGTVEVSSDPAEVIPETSSPEVVVPTPVEEQESADDDGSEQPSSDQSSTAPAGDTAAVQLSAQAIATPIRDVDRISTLNQELRRTIISNREDDWSGPAISYRIRMDEAGNVTGYEANNAASEQYAADLKIPGLVKSSTTEQPQLDFLVVINDDSVVEVNPWDGWP